MLLGSISLMRDGRRKMMKLLGESMMDRDSEGALQIKGFVFEANPF